MRCRLVTATLLMSMLNVACTSGPAGPEGPAGQPGAAGTAGATGPTGAMGAMGATGPTGPTGLNGSDGAAGPAGAVGPGGTVRVLAFDATTIGVNPLPNFPAIVPPNCQTSAAYTAGVGEAAVIDFDGSIATSLVGASGNVYLSVGVKETAAFIKVSAESFSSFNDGSANVHVSKYHPLTAGTSYTFGILFSTSAAGATGLAQATCHGVVTIVKI